MKGSYLPRIPTKVCRLNKLSTRSHRRHRRASRAFVLAYSVVLMAFVMSLLALMLGFVNAQISITKNAIDDLDMGIIMENLGEKFVAGELIKTGEQWYVSGVEYTVPEGYTLSVSDDGLTFTVASARGVILRIVLDESGNITRWTFS